MPSYFSTIGFPIQSDEELLNVANAIAQSATPLEVEGGTYLRWSCQSGAEIWLLVNPDHELLAVNPHFMGTSEVRVRIEGMVDKPGADELDGAFFAWANPVDQNDAPETQPTEEDDFPSEDETEEGQPAPGDYPFVFEAPDFRAYSDLKLPSMALVQLSAFAQEATIFESLEAYENAQESPSPEQSNGQEAPKLSPQSFVPVGLFPTEGQEETIPEPIAMFTGVILEVELKENELSRHPYHYALVETFGGRLDVVIDPEVTNAPPIVGGIIQGMFWLSGRLMDYESEDE
ncbi:MAG: hypothetical protein ACFCD0_12705 [Gemmataceae bacterium]